MPGNSELSAFDVHDSCFICKQNNTNVYCGWCKHILHKNCIKTLEKKKCPFCKGLYSVLSIKDIQETDIIEGGRVIGSRDHSHAQITALLSQQLDELKNNTIYFQDASALQARILELIALIDQALSSVVMHHDRIRLENLKNLCRAVARNPLQSAQLRELLGRSDFTVVPEPKVIEVDRVVPLPLRRTRYGFTRFENDTPLTQWKSEFEQEPGQFNATLDLLYWSVQKFRGLPDSSPDYTRRAEEINEVCRDLESKYASLLSCFKDKITGRSDYLAETLFHAAIKFRNEETAWKYAFELNCVIKSYLENSDRRRFAQIVDCCTEYLFSPQPLPLADFQEQLFGLRRLFNSSRQFYPKQVQGNFLCHLPLAEAYAAYDTIESALDKILTTPLDRLKQIMDEQAEEENFSLLTFQSSFITEGYRVRVADFDFILKQLTLHSIEDRVERLKRLKANRFPIDRAIRKLECKVCSKEISVHQEAVFGCQKCPLLNYHEECCKDITWCDEHFCKLLPITIKNKGGLSSAFILRHSEVLE